MDSLLKYRFLEPNSSYSKSTRTGRGWKMYVSEEHLGDSDARNPWIILEICIGTDRNKRTREKWLAQ